MPEKKTKQKLNPEVVDIEVGVRYLRKVTFYPLSVAHQLKMTDILEMVFQELVGVSQGADKDESVALFFGKVLEIVKENINIIVTLITEEEPETFLADLTNSQLAKIVEYIYTTNFEGPLKNLLSLFQKEGDESNWRELVLNQLSPQSAKSMDIDSNTFTEEVSEKADSLLGK
jgi:hypothetical protein